MRVANQILRVTAALLLGLNGAHAATGNKLSSVSGVRLGMPERSLAESKALFTFDQNGHFGDRVQYNSKANDQWGGMYFTFCRSGKCFGVEVAYPEAGVSRQDALAVVSRILQDIPVKLTEHDDEDLRAGDAKKPGEFFYYGDSVRAELAYKPGADRKVSRVSVWLE